MVMSMKNRRREPINCGIDVSIRGTGLGLTQGKKALAYYKFKQTTKGYSVYKDGGLMKKIFLGKGEMKSTPHRGVAIKKEIQEILKEFKVDRCIIEGNSMNSKNSMVYEIGEFVGIIKAAVVESGLDPLVIPPLTLKEEATGCAGASKENMVYQLKRIFKVDVNGDDDCADALLLAFLF